MDDLDLLREYVRTRSHDAFQQLVTRHLPMVLSAARRLVRDAQLAEEIAQVVFTTFAQKAGSIRPPQIIGGWLYNATRHLSAHAIRTEQRRRQREQLAIAMQTHNPSSPPSLELLEPAMAELDSEDRDALVLRFLENRSLREVGAEFGITEDAARMRVNRALERLRADFEKQGIKSTTALLAAALTAGTISVPTGLGAAISTIALAGTAPAIGSFATLMSLGAMPKMLLTALLGSLVVLGLHEARVATKLRSQLESLSAQQTLATEQNEALARDRDETARLREEDRARANDRQQELARLRSEIARLRGTPSGASAQAAVDPNADVTNALLLVSAVILTNRGPQWPEWINQDQLRARMQTRPGLPYNRLAVDDDVRALHATGLFTNIRATEERTRDGIVLTFLFQEQTNLEPGKYITRKQLAFAGYKTPEASLQSLTWAMVNGNWEMTRTAFMPDVAPDESERSQFETEAQTNGPLFKGMQILARKDLDPEKVELKVLIDSGMPQPNSPDGRELMVQTLVKAGADWKLGGSTHAYRPEWEQSGAIQTFAQ